MKLTSALTLLALFAIGCNGDDDLIEKNCADGYDDDFDGATDCDDDDCFDTLACNPDTSEETDETDDTDDTDETDDYDWEALSSDYPRFTGEETLDNAGYAVLGGRDLSGDGNEDIVIGAHLKVGHDGTSAQAEAGAIYIFHGPVTSGGSLAGADCIYLYDRHSAWFGWALDLPGDLTGDGTEDIVVGAYKANGSGMAYILPGDCSGTVPVLENEDTIKLYGDEDKENAGYALASGDVNGDGQVDLLVGADQNGFNYEGAGRAYLIHGPIDGKVNLDEADAGLAGETAGDRAGKSVSIVDLNGDGNDDVIVGAYHHAHIEDLTESGAIYAVYGPVPGHLVLSSADMRWDGVKKGDWAGDMAELAGDVDGDGYDDLLVGASHESTKGSSAGAAYLIKGQSGRYSGSGTLSSPDVGAHAKLMGSTGSDNAGWSAAAAGDVNGDGRDDVVVSAFGWDREHSNRGAAFVKYGPVEGVHELRDYADAIFLGEGRDDQAGLGLGPAGDHNGDSHDDFLVGAPWQDSAGTDAGAIYLVSGL